MKIEERAIYAIDRTQFTGYDQKYSLTTGESLTFHSFRTAYEPTCEQTCAAFDNKFPGLIRDVPGVILWMDVPTAIRDLGGWFVHCTYAITEDLRFTDPSLLVEPARPPAKHPALTVEQMLVRT